jgi:glycosyltransferase involved in cell wall biosynthesis
VYVNSSTFEGMSNTILEAMASGRPVVATAVGGNPELVRDGVSGYLVSSGDHQAMARRILSLLDDPARARSFGQAGRQAVEHRHSMAAMIDAYRALYHHLAHRPDAAGAIPLSGRRERRRAVGGA